MLKENIRISKLKYLKDNPRKISSKNLDKLKRELEEYDELLDARPVLVNQTREGFEVFSGNHRVKAAKELGWQEIPAFVFQDLDRQRMKEIALIENQHYAEHDFQELSKSEWSKLIKKLDLPELKYKSIMGDTERDFENDDLTDEYEQKEFKHICPRCKFEFD